MAVLRQFIPLTALSLLMMAYGFSVTMIGPLLPDILAGYGLNLSSGGLFETFRSIGGIIAAFVGGLVSDRVSKKWLVALMFAGYGLTLAAIGRAPEHALLLLLFFTLGFTTRLVDSVSNALTADLYPTSSGTALNLLHMMFGVGALLGPLFARAVLNAHASWQSTYGSLVGLCAFVLVFYVLALYVSRHRWGFPIHRTAGMTGRGIQPGFLRSMMRSLPLWMAAGIMFLYAGHQATMSVWLPLYVENDLGGSVFVASLGSSMFWIGIVCGRFVSMLLVRQVRAEIIVAMGCILGGILLGAGFLSHSAEMLLAASLLTGLLTGGTIPLLISVTCAWFPASTGSVSAFIYLSASVARAIIPWLTGVLGQQISLPFGMALAWLTLLTAGILSYVMQRLSSGDRRRGPS